MKSAGERTVDGMREVGTLLITFGPLDAAVAHEDPWSTQLLLLFLSLGLCLFIVAIVLERRL